MFFDPPRYFVDESIGKIDVILRRTGTDLSKPSSVFVRSRQTDPISATGNKNRKQFQRFCKLCFCFPSLKKILQLNVPFFPLKCSVQKNKMTVILCENMAASLGTSIP